MFLSILPTMEPTLSLHAHRARHPRKAVMFVRSPVRPRAASAATPSTSSSMTLPTKRPSVLGASAMTFTEGRRTSQMLSGGKTDGQAAKIPKGRSLHRLPMDLTDGDLDLPLVDEQRMNDG